MDPDVVGGWQDVPNVGNDDIFTIEIGKEDFISLVRYDKSMYVM